MIAARSIPDVLRNSRRIDAFSFDLQQQGLQVNTCTFQNVASHLSQNFNEKNKSKETFTFSFVMKIGLTHCAGTHVAQKEHKECKEEAKHFAMMHERVVHMDPDDIINMDQTSILYLHHSKQTLEKRNIDHP